MSWGSGMGTNDFLEGTTKKGGDGVKTERRAASDTSVSHRAREKEKRFFPRRRITGEEEL